MRALPPNIALTPISERRRQGRAGKAAAARGSRRRRVAICISVIYTQQHLVRARGRDTSTSMAMVGQNGGRTGTATSPSHFNYIYGLTVTRVSFGVGMTLRRGGARVLPLSWDDVHDVVGRLEAACPTIATAPDITLEGSLDPAVQRRASVWRAPQETARPAAA